MSSRSIIKLIIRRVRCVYRAMHKIPYELILVDNCSTDGTRDFLKDVKATVIVNATNLGCAKAWNQGVRAATGQVIGILNNDIIVTPGWLEGLLLYMEHYDHGVVCPSARKAG